MITWDAVGEAFWVAKRDGEHYGFIEKTADARYIAFNHISEPVGRYTRVEDAKVAMAGLEAWITAGEARAERKAMTNRQLRAVG